MVFSTSKEKQNRSMEYRGWLKRLMADVMNFRHIT